jgi:hypothetical protein
VLKKGHGSSKIMLTWNGFSRRELLTPLAGKEVQKIVM